AHRGVLRRAPRRGGEGRGRRGLAREQAEGTAFGERDDVAAGLLEDAGRHGGALAAGTDDAGTGRGGAGPRGELVERQLQRPGDGELEMLAGEARVEHRHLVGAKYLAGALGIDVFEGIDAAAGCLPITEGEVAADVFVADAEEVDG